MDTFIKPFKVTIYWLVMSLLKCFVLIKMLCGNEMLRNGVKNIVDLKLVWECSGYEAPVK